MTPTQKAFLVLTCLFALALSAFGQQYATLGNVGLLADQTFSAGSYQTAALSVAAGQFSGMNYFKVECTPLSGSVISNATVFVDSSIDGVTWTLGGAISAQNCTSEVSATNGPSAANYVRLDLSVTGSGSVRVRLLGAMSSLAGNGSGTVTQVNSSGGLCGGPISGAGTLSVCTGGVTNLMLANPSLTVTAGTGLSGGGSVALGNSVTLNLASTITAGSCTNCNLSYNDQGQLTVAANGTGGGGGFPSIAGVSNVTGRSTSQSSTNIVASTAAAGSYRISYYLDQNAACTTGANSVELTFNWTDGSNARSANSVMFTMGTTQSVASGSIQGAIPIYAALASAINYSSTVTGVCSTGGPSSYDLHISVEELQ